jgi:glycosyltransferase involved in cell wall biosynthesis
MPRDNDWAVEQGLVGRFVVMHSGNIGHAQDLDTLLRATTLLRDLDDLAVVLIGAGARRDALRGLATRLDADAVRFLPYQLSGTLSSSLSTADVHFVGLAAGLAGYVVPSRVYGIMAAGKAMIVSADAESETAELVSEVGCGIIVPPGRPDLVAGAIREARDGRHDLEEMGRRGLEFVGREASHEIAFRRYRELIGGLAGNE